MANIYSVEYSNALIVAPRGNNYAYGRAPKQMGFNVLAQTVAGAAGDVMYLGTPIPPRATICMWESWLRWGSFTSGATLSLGWLAYRDEDGVPVAASAAGLLSAISLTTAGGWQGGVIAGGSPASSLPVVDELVLNNKTPVTIVATIGAQAPGVGAFLRGRLHYYAA